jgi:hypothetical protein
MSNPQQDEAGALAAQKERLKTIVEAALIHLRPAQMLRRRVGARQSWTGDV